MTVGPIQGTVFISYARADAGDLAARLHADLAARGIPAWIDTSAIDGGASWTEEIERAIDGCHSALALVSRASFRSNVCRAEQLRALRKGKLVVPLLAQRDADRPLYLEHLNYRDLSDPSNYEAGLERILADVASGRVTPLPDDFRRTRLTAPPLPPHFVARESALVSPRRMLTSDGVPRIVGLHGMGGLGKTVLTQALCHDPVVQDAFPDGIIWFTIGPGSVELLEQLREAGKCLNDSTGDYSTKLTATNQLRTLLQGKAVLLVLDDVVNAAQLEPFRTDEQSAPRVRILFTTRDTSVGLHWAAAMCPAPAFEPAQSIRLLEEWAGRADVSSHAIAERFAHLPLAMRIAGALMSEGMPGADLLREIQRVSDLRIDRYSSAPEANLAACFDVSITRLPQDDQQLYYAFGLLTRSNRIPVRLVSTLWMTLRPKLSEMDCTQIARTLGHRALLDFVEDRITLHPLLHDYATERVHEARDVVSAGTDGLVLAMRDPSWIVREMAIEALGRIGGESAFSAALRAGSGDDDMDVRLKALSVLAELGEPRAIPSLIDLLKENYYETTLAAAQALAAIGEPAVAPLLTALPALRGIGLQDGIRALELIGDARALSVLKVLEGNPDVSYDLHTSDGIVRRNAATEACDAIRAKALGHTE